MMTMSERVKKRYEVGTPMSSAVLSRFMRKHGIGWIVRELLLNFGSFREFLNDWTFFVERTTQRKIFLILDDLEGENGPSGEAVEKSG